MPFVRRHVTRRLKAAKTECDNELQRVTNNITAFFEERLRESEHEHELDRDREWARDRDSQLSDTEHLQEPFVFQHADLRSALQAEESGSDGGYEAELESSHYSHHRTRSTTNSPHSAPTLAHWSSSPGLLTASSAQSLSPSLRRQTTLPWERDRSRPLDTSTSSSTLSSSPATSTAALSELASSRRQPNPTTPASWSSQSISSRRLSRGVPMPIRATHSGQSSRSTSRSRSPMPPSTQSNFLDNSTGPVNRRSSRLLLDDPVDPIMGALYELIGVATDVQDMSLSQLTTQPKLSELIVQRVQNIGKAWEEHPEWPGRNWYVQVLLAIASLSRVVEWWEAEKQFWNFDDNDDEEDEPLAFVTKPADEGASMTVSQLDAGMAKLKLTSEDATKLHPSRPPSQGRKFSGDYLKDSSMASPPRESPALTPSKLMDHTESARVLATERLRLQAEMAQHQNIVVELSLDGDHFIWVNYAWRVVVGYETLHIDP
jgi:serine/threonine-protein kinase RIM15